MKRESFMKHQTLTASRHAKIVEALQWKSEVSLGNVQGAFDKKQHSTAGLFTGGWKNVCPSSASSETSVLSAR